MNDTTIKAASPTERQRDLLAAAALLGDVCRMLRPYANGDLTDGVTRGRFYALRSRAVLLDAAGRVEQ